MTAEGYIQVGLIWATLAAYLGALVARLAGGRALSRHLYATGFGLAAAAWLVRWLVSGHVPLSNMYEILLFMAALMWPLTRASRLLGVDGGPWDMFVGMVLLVGPGFFMDGSHRPLAPALQSSLFVPHVLAYMLAYVILVKAGVAAGVLLVKGDTPPSGQVTPRSVGVHRLVGLGFPLLTGGLILGAWWGKLAWGDWWNWDPKEMWSLVCWLIYAGYFHFGTISRRRYVRAEAAIVLAGAVAILITLLVVNFSKIFVGIHSYAYPISTN